jgi:hypothetical protein|tara:strand:+ start:2257 stop:3135 length:879 start_codon:yes stop_codon:yes gene_type:complete
MQNEQNTMAQIDEQEVEGMQTEPTATSEDIFSEIFGTTQEQLVTDSPNEAISNTTDTQTMSDPKSDPGQFQYWQSQADKRSAEVDMLKSQMADVMSKVSTPQADKPTQQETALEKPVKPVKPSSYDHSEALTDPDSASAKYLTKQSSYLEDMTEYVELSNNYYVNQMNQQQEAQKAMARDNKVMQDLQVKYNYTPEQANDFMQKMSSPDSLSLDNLVQLHQLKQPNAAQQVTQITPEAQKKVALMNQRQEKLSIPKPIGVQPGASDQSLGNKNTEDKMMDAMIRNVSKRNIF